MMMMSDFERSFQHPEMSSVFTFHRKKIGCSNRKRFPLGDSVLTDDDCEKKDGS